MERQQKTLQVRIPSDAIQLEGTLTVPADAIGIVLFAHVVLAVPVGPSDAIEWVRKEVDDVSLTTPAMFFGIGEFYEDFHQLTDAEVIHLLKQAQPQAASART